MKDLDKLQQEKEELLSELEDMRLLYETIAEHSSLIENELEQKNQEITTLINQLKKYLSPQLFQSIVGGQNEVSLNYKRRFLTIFFSDIVGFTEISDRSDPEVLSELLNGYLNEMALIAHKYGGTIDKFIGDAIMVFFGDPEYFNDEKHATDCCSMALEMQLKNQELDILWKKKGVTGLSVRMGIHSGYCTVGNSYASYGMDYTIIGGNVNIASRLEATAISGSILISSVTRNLLPSQFQTTFIQELKVKGIHYPIEVYELIKHNLVDYKTLPENLYLKVSDEGFSLPAFIQYKDLENSNNRRQLTLAIQHLMSWMKEKE